MECCGVPGKYEINNEINSIRIQDTADTVTKCLEEHSTQNSELRVTAATQFTVDFILVQSNQLTGSAFTQILFLAQSEDSKESEKRKYIYRSLVNLFLKEMQINYCIVLYCIVLANFLGFPMANSPFLGP